VDLKERRETGTQRHPWEIARAELFLSLLTQRDLLGGRDWLDVGAGDAWFADRLRTHLPNGASLTCWDPNYALEDLATDQHTGITLTRDRPARRFDRILILDVIEHVEDDDRYLSAIVADLLTDDGWVLVSVPAYQSLFSSHDEALGHHRRYSPNSCRSLLTRSGLAVRSDGGLCSSLLFPRAIEVALERAGLVHRRAHGIGAWSARRAPTAVITRALILDGKLALTTSRLGHPLPGLSYWALCSRAR
jgi:hypothetical protein